MQKRESCTTLAVQRGKGSMYDVGRTGWEVEHVRHWPCSVHISINIFDECRNDQSKLILRKKVHRWDGRDILPCCVKKKKAVFAQAKLLFDVPHLSFCLQGEMYIYRRKKSRESKIARQQFGEGEREQHIIRRGYHMTYTSHRFTF